jgi:3-methyladenine DNA glycosylase Tag
VPSAFQASLATDTPTLDRADLPDRPGRMTSPESHQLAGALRKQGFRLVGPVVAQSFMQTVGIEDGHFEGCFRAPAAD